MTDSMDAGEVGGYASVALEVHGVHFSLPAFAVLDSEEAPMSIALSRTITSRRMTCSMKCVR